MSDDPLPVEVRPTIRPTLLWLCIVVLLGGGAIAIVTASPRLVGGREIADLVVRALAFLTAVGVVRFLIRAYVLRRTTYRIEADEVHKEYRLLFRVHERTVPFSRVRSHEMNQSRVENLLGYGTISLNRGLGAIEVENVPDPEELHRQVTDLVGEH